MRLRTPFAVVGSGLVACLAWSGCFQSFDGFTGGPLDAALSPEGASLDASLEADVIATPEGGSVDAGPHCQVGNPTAETSPMLRVLDQSYCIDTTEVTYDQYNAFLAAKFPIPDACSFKTAYRPMASRGNRAMGDVDWCDAYSFCAWAGKRLCHGRNGVTLDLDNSLTNASEWQYACTHGGKDGFAYPYGDSAKPNICLYGDSPGVDGSREVGSNPQCSGPDGIFDLSGNVWEWEDACDRGSGDPSGKACNLRGGGFLRPSSDWGACADVPGGWYRDSHVDDTGIRCCADYE